MVNGLRIALIIIVGGFLIFLFLNFFKKSCNVYDVKFREEYQVRTRNNQLVSLSGKDISSFNIFLQLIPGASIGRIFSRPEAELDKEKFELETISGKKLADLNSWYDIHLRIGMCGLDKIIMTMPFVETVYPNYGVTLASP